MFSTEWAILCIWIQQRCPHLEAIVFLQFNQLANCFHALEINSKSKIKKNMLITISLELLPRLVGTPAQCKKQQPFCPCPLGKQKGMWGTLEDPIRENKSWEFEFLKGKLLLLEGQWAKTVWGLVYMWTDSSWAACMILTTVFLYFLSTQPSRTALW